MANNQIVDSKSPAADLTVTPWYKGYVAYAALQAEKQKEFSARPDVASLTAADVEKFKELVFAPTPGYYYLVKSKDSRYYLCKLESFENQGRAAAYWKLTFSYEEISLGTPRPDQPTDPGAKIHGKKVYPDGSSYEGDWLNGKFHGQGTLKSADGLIYQGDFVNGQFQGKGSIIMTDRTSYQGDFVNGIFQGQGVLTMPDGAFYKGAFVNGKMQGPGILKYPDGRYYEGDFVNNEVQGQGTLYDTNGKVLKKGQWAHNEFMGLIQPEPSIPVKTPGVVKAINSIYFFSSSYGKYGNFVRLNLDTMTIQPLEFNGEHLAVSPDNQYLVYQGKSDIFHAYNLGAGTDKQFVQDYAYCSAPVFISRHLFAFLKSMDRNTYIVIKSVLNGQERQMPHTVPEGVRYTADIDFVPPLGNLMSFVIASGDTLYLVSDQATRVIYKSNNKADHVRYPAVSPDGKKVTFVSDLHKGIWVINLDGTGLTQLTTLAGQYTAWSPDSKFIAFSSVSSAARGILYKDLDNSSQTDRGVGSFTHRIWVMGSDGSNPHPLQGKDGKAIGIMGNLIWR